ncbi:hypothetical protein NC651_020572 [Populus alba x Populus x berolinensis]|nr:hypothetical protein NC651_020572 [Populus alba x Populus x berolinensis]
MRRLATVAAAVWQDTTVWTQAPLSGIDPAAESLFHVRIDVLDSPDLAASHTRAGQYLQLRVPDVEKPSFLAIASPPSDAASKGAFNFLVKSVAGSTAELLCGLKRGDVVELSQAMGRGFDIDQIEPAEKYPTVLIFATGSGFNADKRSDVRLYYGARNLKRMAYQLLLVELIEACDSSSYRIGLKTGSLLVLRLCQCYHNQMIIERVKVTMYRFKQIYSPTGTGNNINSCIRWSLKRENSEELRKIINEVHPVVFILEQQLIVILYSHC